MKKWQAYKVAASTEVYIAADVDALPLAVIMETQAQRIVELRSALKAIAAFDVGEFRGLEEEIAIHRIATQALAE